MNCLFQWLSAPENTIAAATVISALATVVLASITLYVTKRQIRREREERKPNLIVPWVMWTDKGFEFRFTNLGQYPIFIGAVVYEPYGRKLEQKMPELLLAPASSNGFEFETAPVVVSESGEFRVFFQYGATGTMYHRLAFPYEVRGGIDTLVNESGTMDLNGPIEQEITVSVWRRKLKVNLGEESKIVKECLISKTVFGTGNR